MSKMGHKPKSLSSNDNPLSEPCVNISLSPDSETDLSSTTQELSPARGAVRQSLAAVSIKKNGPASAPTLPSHGSIPSPSKRTEKMNMHTNITMRAKAPARNDATVADAMRDLEETVCDLVNMSTIAADLILLAFDQPDATDSSGMLVYRLSRSRRENLEFAVADVENRAKSLKKAYLSACEGKVL